jgi:hypothetical protein
MAKKSKDIKMAKKRWIQKATNRMKRKGTTGSFTRW